MVRFKLNEIFGVDKIEDPVTIPLWFDSNEFSSLRTAQHEGVTIPLWFDSNVSWQRQTPEGIILSQFHYGSIQTVDKKGQPMFKGMSQFHYGSIQTNKKQWRKL